MCQNLTLSTGANNEQENQSKQINKSKICFRVKSSTTKLKEISVQLEKGVQTSIYDLYQNMAYSG